MIDLWPKEIAVIDQKSPVTILKEQASLLGEKTRNIVVAVLEKDPNIGVLPKEYVFRYGFLLTCPSLGHYRFGLFTVSYGIDMYPVYFTFDGDVAEEIVSPSPAKPGKDGSLLANDEQEFTEILRQIFSSRKTLRVIHALLSQAGNGS